MNDIWNKVNDYMSDECDYKVEMDDMLKDPVKAEIELDREYRYNGYDWFKKAIRDICDEIKLHMYIVDTREFMWEMLGYPYRLIAVYDILTEKQINEKIIPNNLKDKFYLDDVHLMLDSGIFNPNISNEVILGVAEQLQPKVIVPKDYHHNNEKTIESILSFMEMKESYKLKDYELMLPLQPPYIIAPEFKDHVYFGIGGTTNVTQKRNSIAHEVSKKYPDKQFHLFGADLGCSFGILGSCPNIKSVDSTPVQWSARDKTVNRGKMSTLNRTLHSAFRIINNLVGYYNFMLTQDNRLGKELW